MVCGNIRNCLHIYTHTQVSPKEKTVSLSYSIRVPQLKTQQEDSKKSYTETLHLRQTVAYLFSNNSLPQNEQTLLFQNPTDFVHEENKQIKVSVPASLEALSISILNKHRNIHINTIGGFSECNTKNHRALRGSVEETLEAGKTPSLP